MASYSITLDVDDSGDQIFRITDGVNQFKTLNYKPYEVRNIGNIHFAVYSEGVLAFQCRYTEITNPAGTAAQKYAALQDLFNVPAPSDATLTTINTTLGTMNTTLSAINTKLGTIETLRNTYQNDVFTNNALGTDVNPNPTRAYYGIELHNPNGQTAYVKFVSASLGDRIYTLQGGQSFITPKSETADYDNITAIALDKSRNFTFVGTNFTIPVVIILKY